MKFYVLETPKPDSPEDFAGRIDVMKPDKGVNRGPAPTCPRCGRVLGMMTWLPPYRIGVETWGRRYGDVARTGDDLIVSDRFKKAFEERGLRGIKDFEPVEVIKVTHRRGKPKEPMPRYFKGSVAFSPTAIDQKASGYVWEDESRVCSECQFDRLADVKRYKRLVIKEDTWNGDDVFFPRGGRRVMVSERFRSMFHEYQLLGAVFIPSESEEAGRDRCPWETQTN